MGDGYSLDGPLVNGLFVFFPAVFIGAENCPEDQITCLSPAPCVSADGCWNISPTGWWIWGNWSPAGWVTRFMLCLSSSRFISVAWRDPAARSCWKVLRNTHRWPVFVTGIFLLCR